MAKQNPLIAMKRAYAVKARQKRAELFRELFPDAMNCSILDLGGGDGEHIASILPGHRNVTIADVNPKKLAHAEATFGFKPKLLEGEGGLDFKDGAFDIVFCSSVIEHVTGPKDEMTKMRSTSAFERKAAELQRGFAEEIRRVGRGYFVQTPHKYFALESHTNVPGFVMLLPRSVQLQVWKMWPLTTHAADFRLLTTGEMERLFPDAALHLEYAAGMVKSIMAVRQPGSVGGRQEARALSHA